MQYARRLSRLTTALLLAFLVVAGGAAYWSVFGADALLARSDNPRLLEAEEGVDRGQIVDRNGIVLAESVPGGTTLSGALLFQRQYPQPSAVSATGYYSPNAQTGVELAFNPVLRGDTITSTIDSSLDQLLHRTTIGSDVRLTIDLPTQQAALSAMEAAYPNGDARGALIMIDAQSGAIRAWLSLPLYDPAVLSDPGQNATLAADPSAPLLNRVDQASYPPGGSLESIVLAALIAGQTSLTQPLAQVDQPVTAAGLTLGCLQPAQSTASLQVAYASACPAPFAQAAYDHPADLQSALKSFGLLRAPTLGGFTLPDPPGVTPLDALPVNSALLRAQGAGQGLLSVSPLQMAVVAATIANHGEAQPLSLVDATRAPGTDQWLAIGSTATPIAVTSQATADTIRQAMAYAVSNGTAHTAAQPGLTVYGHASLAYSGPQRIPIAWFIGFVDLPGGHSLAIAVALENIADAQVAATVGGKSLKIAASQFTSATP